MTFEKLFDQACTAAHLPDMARILLPSILSERTKKMVLQLGPEEFGQILSTVIETINHGSVESVDRNLTPDSIVVYESTVSLCL